MRAKIISRYSVKVIDYDIEKEKADDLYLQALRKEGVEDETINIIIKKKDKTRTDEDHMKIIARKYLEDDYKGKIKELDSYKDYVPSEFFGEIKYTDNVRPYYIEEGESVIQKWEVVPMESGKIFSKIESLKKELSDGDYKIIKIYEAKISLKDNPYSTSDSEEFINQRQLIRDEINRLESLLPNKGEIEEMYKKR